MASRRAGSFRYNIEEEEEEVEDLSESGFEEEENKKAMTTAAPSGRRGSSGAGGSTLPCCQADNCTAELTDARRYHRRHKVCEFHAKAQAVNVAGVPQRFCQQCSRFHELPEFDENKRSCRMRLAGHNQRRRKNLADFHGEGSGAQ